MKVIVIGAGASGMMCAATAAASGAEVLLLERNDRCGRKLAITGKGRCNVTNACFRDEFLKNVPTNPRFLYSALSAFSPEDTVSFFESLGVPMKVERGNRVFPVSDQAADVVRALVRYCEDCGVTLRTATVSSLLVRDGSVCGVRLSDGSDLAADKVVVACGGASYPGTGSDGSGFRLARECGHTVVDPRPSLVPWEMKEAELCRSLQGLSLKNTALRVEKEGKTVYTDFGEMLFTHFGVTGPMILSASTVLQPDMILHLDLKPALTEEQLDKRLLSDLEKYRAKNLSNSFDDLLPSKLILPFLLRCGLDPNAKAYTVTRALRRDAVSLLKDFPLTALRSRPISEAIVTAGGVHVAQVDPRTMESRVCDGLYFCGEVLDVDAYTGGFNLQIAFSTGYLAGISSADAR